MRTKRRMEEENDACVGKVLHHALTTVVMRSCETMYATDSVSCVVGPSQLLPCFRVLSPSSITITTVTGLPFHFPLLFVLYQLLSVMDVVSSPACSAFSCKRNWRRRIENYAKLKFASHLLRWRRRKLESRYLHWKRFAQRYVSSTLPRTYANM